MNTHNPHDFRFRPRRPAADEQVQYGRLNLPPRTVSSEAFSMVSMK